MIFFGIGPVSISVLEVDPEIFHRLAGQLFADSSVYGFEGGVIRDAEGPSERLRIRRVPLHCAGSDCAELRNGVGGEQLRAAINGMYRLPSLTLPGMRFRELEICLAKPG